MRYQKFTPATELTPFIECYFVWEGEAKESLDVQSPPNVFNAMVFNYADPYEGALINALVSTTNRSIIFFQQCFQNLRGKPIGNGFVTKFIQHFSVLNSRGVIGRFFQQQAYSIRNLLLLVVAQLMVDFTRAVVNLNHNPFHSISLYVSVTKDRKLNALTLIPIL